MTLGRTTWTSEREVCRETARKSELSSRVIFPLFWHGSFIFELFKAFDLSERLSSSRNTKNWKIPSSSQWKGWESIFTIEIPLVLRGRYEGATGVGVRVEDNVIVPFSDLTMHEMKGLPKDGQVSSERASGIDGWWPLQWRDSVEIDQQRVGVIVRVSNGNSKCQNEIKFFSACN